MLKKHIIFFDTKILYTIVGHLCPASLKLFIFYKVPPSDKHSLLWLANWHSALWLAEHHKPVTLSLSYMHTHTYTTHTQLKTPHLNSQKQIL